MSSAIDFETQILDAIEPLLLDAMIKNNSREFFQSFLSVASKILAVDNLAHEILGKKTKIKRLMLPQYEITEL